MSLLGLVGEPVEAVVGAPFPTVDDVLVREPESINRQGPGSTAGVSFRRFECT